MRNELYIYRKKFYEENQTKGNEIYKCFKGKDSKLHLLINEISIKRDELNDIIEKCNKKETPDKSDLDTINKLQKEIEDLSLKIDEEDKRIKSFIESLENSREQYKIVEKKINEKKKELKEINKLINKILKNKNLIANYIIKGKNVKKKNLKL